MADLKSSSTAGGGLVWTQTNLPFSPQDVKLFYNGNEVIDSVSNQSIGGTKTFTGTLIYKTPVSSNEVAIKGYVDSLDSTSVKSVTGTLPLVVTSGVNPRISINNVTQSANGAMSKEDKVKLDGLPVRAVNRDGDTMTGNLTVNANIFATGEIRSNHNILMQDSLYSQRMSIVSGTGYFQSGKTDRNLDDQKMAFSGYLGVPLSSSIFTMKQGVNPKVNWGSNYYDVLHRGNMPTPSDIDAYTKSEVDQIVTDSGSGLKQVQLSVPAGSPSTGYVPIIFTNVNHNEYCYISTKTSGGSDPMNNCVFDGIVRSGGWSDRGSYVTGQFNIYSENERALHSIHGGTETDNFYVAYVEVRAFPVTVKVPVGVGVATNTTVSYGTSVFVTNGQDGVGNTKSILRCDFSRGSGLYRSGNRVYDQGFKPTPADVGTLSESVINTELNKKFDKVGGTITGLTSIEGRTTLGAYSIKRSGVTGYANFGQLAAAGTIGEAVLGIGTSQESITSYLKVGDDKLEFVSNDLPKKVFHEGQVPTLGKDLGLQWQLPSPGGTARYVRLVTLGLTDNDTTFILSGFGDHGSAKRATYNVTVATRSSGISVDVNSLDVDLLSGGKPRFYHRRVGDVFEVWVKTPAFNLDATFTRMSGRGGVIRIDSTTTTEPADLTEVTVNQIYTTRFKPTPSDVGTLSESVINAELNKKFDKVGGDITGDVRFNSGNTTRLSLGSGTDYYIERSPSGLFLSSGSINPKVRVNNTNYDIYHGGNRPSATDLNVVGRYNLGPTSDLRALRNGGMYRLSDIVEGGPENQNMAYGQLLHVNGASDTHMQIVGNYQSTKLYWRGFNNSNLGGTWRKVYHDGDMPTPGEIGALPITGGTLTGTITVPTIYLTDTQGGGNTAARRDYVDGRVSTCLPLTGGTLTGNLVVNGGEIRSSGAISYYSNNTNLGIILSSSAAGYTEIVRNSTSGEWNDGLRSYGGADWRIGSNRIYTQGFKPSPGDLGAVSKSGDNITGQMQYTGSFNGTSNQAQIAHLGNDASQSLFIRNMREHYTSAWIWEKVYSGSLYYAMGVNGNSTSKIRLSPGTTGEIYLGNADKRVYHEGYETTPAKIGALPISGGTLTGTITVPNIYIVDAQGTGGNTVTRRDYVDGQLNTKLSRFGGIIDGNLAVNGYITSGGTITAAGNLVANSGYLKLNEGGVQAIEFVKPGSSAIMIYQDPSSKNLIFATSNGSGGATASRMVIDASGTVSVAGGLNAPGGLFEGQTRVYSPNNPPPAKKLANTTWVGGQIPLNQTTITLSQDVRGYDGMTLIHTNGNDTYITFKWPAIDCVFQITQGTDHTIFSLTNNGRSLQRLQGWGEGGPWQGWWIVT